MRYITACAQSIPMFVLIMIWGARGLPHGWMLAALIVSSLAGVVLGHAMSAKMVNGLLSSESFAPRLVPGGIWFFVGLGVAGGIILAMLPKSVFGSTHGLLMVHLCVMAMGTFLCAVFTTLALSVRRLEQSQGKNVWMSRAGFRFVNR